MNIFTVILTQPLANGLIAFYKLTGNMGVAIILFSLVLIFLLRPLTKPYMESMKKIKELEPQINKLKKKYGKDKLKFSQAQAELYKQKKINPGAGCLPYILQIVVLISLFKVFTTALSGTNGEVIGKLNEYLYTPLKIATETTINTKFLYLDTSKPDVFRLPGVPFPLPGIVLLLAAVAQFLSVKITAPVIKKEEQIAKKTKEQADDMQVAMTQSMTYTMPVMTIFFGMSFPSGLALYWLVYSIFNVYQQVSTSGWGAATPFIKRLGLVKSSSAVVKSQIK